MGTMATARINTTQSMVLYRDFIIEQASAPGGDVWQWTHEDYVHGATPQCLQITGDCQTLFECIDAVEAWHAVQPREGKK